MHRLISPSTSEGYPELLSLANKSGWSGPSQGALAVVEM